MSRDESVIYALFDPREPDKIRYVGQSTNIASRYVYHSGKSAFMPTRKRTWTITVLDAGLKPGLKLLEIVPTIHGNLAEEKWIKHYFFKDGHLVNPSIPNQFESFPDKIGREPTQLEKDMWERK